MMLINLTEQRPAHLYRSKRQLSDQAMTGWSVIVDLREPTSAAQRLTHAARQIWPHEVLPLILPPEAGLTNEQVQALAEWRKPLLLFSTSIGEWRELLGQQGTAVIDELSMAKWVRQSDWLVVTIQDAGRAAQVIALRDIRPPWFEVDEIAHDIHAITELGHHECVRSFLVIGEREAVLIDTGIGIDDIRPVAEHLTTLPIRVVLTHSHWDHVGSIHRFERVAIHEAERQQLAEGAPIASERLTDLQEQLRMKYIGRPLPPYFKPEEYSIPGCEVTETLVDSDAIELGNRTLRVVHAPGHSKGSICLFDAQRRQLFLGDVFYYGPLYCEDLDTYTESARRLADMAEHIDLAFSSHNELSLLGRPMNGKDLVNLHHALSRIQRGMVENSSLPAFEFPEEKFSVLAGFPY